ncbi:MAG: trehalase family glycosidase [Bacillota bacterium]|nr:trehalase family glycosidase [Bacillota bacterium]
MDIEKAKQLIKDYAYKNYCNMTREPSGIIKYPFIVPGSQSYHSCLWDWDSWLTNVAIRQIIKNTNDSSGFEKYEKGCILNFLDHTDKDGGMPIVILPDRIMPTAEKLYESNMHKPVIAQHLAFVIKENGNDANWIKGSFSKLEKFIGVYLKNYRHETGLFFWQDDFAIGVDNDPCTFYRPPKSSGSIYLNCLMFKELKAMEYISGLLGLDEKQLFYKNEAENLKKAIQEYCWDERDGFYYSVDFNLLPVDPNSGLHKGAPRHWNCLIQRIEVWSGFLAMWAGIVTREQAKRMVEHLLNEKTFNAPAGVRTLSKMEKMYRVVESNNPSCWLGPIWGISNYMVFSALTSYGFEKEARELAEKTINMFGEDIENCGEMHEYYDPETGAPILNPGFQNWNLLSVNMIEWLDGKTPIKEF